MTQALSKPLTFEEFLEWYPEDGRRYELIEGEIVEMPPGGRAGYVTHVPSVSTHGCTGVSGVGDEMTSCSEQFQEEGAPCA